LFGVIRCWFWHFLKKCWQKIYFCYNTLTTWLELLYIISHS
jgi:hypothetical protein